jgi:glycolate oxidase subunit GlcD
MSKSVIDALVKILDASRVTTDSTDLINYGQDWTRFVDPVPLAIVFPKTSVEVQQVVQLANNASLHLVPSGGRTGLSGGAIAYQGEVVVSLEKMNRILEVDKLSRTINCEAGVITQQLQQTAIEAGLYYPVDFASSGSSQIGGNVATNAGGIKVIRYGMTRDWIAGLKIVTGNGDILELNKGLAKNATGLDLRHLISGSEGVLGIVTEVTVKVCRAPKNLTVLVLGVPEFEAMMSILHQFQSEIDITAFEFFSEEALQKVVSHHHLKRPVATSSPYYALLEFENINQSTENKAMELFESCMEMGWVEDGCMSQSESDAAMMWSLRERISETITPYSPYKNDISVIVSKVPEFLKRVDSVVSEHYPEFEIIWFGHIGDGNLHLNILKPAELPKVEFVEKCEKVNRWVFDIVAELGGSISAEHGIGLLKKQYLKYSRSEQEITIMKGIKKVFDANGVLNPGKLWD